MRKPVAVAAILLLGVVTLASQCRPKGLVISEATSESGPWGKVIVYRVETDEPLTAQKVAELFGSKGADLVAVGQGNNGRWQHYFRRHVP